MFVDVNGGFTFTALFAAIIRLFLAGAQTWQ